jgi:CRP-like cAMP-binding protein
MSDTVQYPAGAIIFRQGYPGDHAYIVQQGEVDIFLEEIDRTETHLATLGAGEMFGELALLEEKPRSATVRAKTDVVLQILDI